MITNKSYDYNAKPVGGHNNLAPERLTCINKDFLHFSLWWSLHLLVVEISTAKAFYTTRTKTAWNAADSAI